MIILLVFILAGNIMAQEIADSLISETEIDQELTITDSIPTQEEADGDAPIPPLRIEEDKEPLLEIGDTFFDFEPRIDRIESEIDSLKKMVKFYQKSQGMPSLNKELLNLIKIPQLRHRVELTNGTVIIGELVEENVDYIILQTSLGRLKIGMDKVVHITEDEPVSAKIEIMGEPFVNAFPDREEITGMVKNTGKLRADFVRIIANLWTKTTDLAGKDSSFVSGTETTYSSGVITDSALEPGATTQFKVIVPLTDENDVEYRTYDLRWAETE
jgi:CBS domain-containing protein